MKNEWIEIKRHELAAEMDRSWNDGITVGFILGFMAGAGIMWAIM